MLKVPLLGTESILMKLHKTFHHCVNHTHQGPIQQKMHLEENFGNFTLLISTHAPNGELLPDLNFGSKVRESGTWTTVDPPPSHTQAIIKFDRLSILKIYPESYNYL